MSLPKLLESKTRIQHHDCDPYNHLNNSKYIDLMVATRTEQILEHYQFHSADFVSRHGVGWVIAQSQISYFYPASWMEVVTIETRLLQFSESSLLVEALMWDEHKTHLKAVLWSKLVHFQIAAQRSAPHSEELMALFAEVHAPLDGQPSFEERVKSFKRAKANA